MYVKRVIGTSGETLEYNNDTLYINGLPVPEPYLDQYRKKAKEDGLPAFTEDFGPITIPEGEVFVLGDNRLNSRDSRQFGPIKWEQIKGKMIKKLVPSSHAN